MAAIRKRNIGPISMGFEESLCWLLYHAGCRGVSGGFVGVDVFFVISGYLITSILVGDIHQGKFSIARFYERRARRILPALFAVLLVSSVAAYKLLLPQDLRDYAASMLAALFFSSNFVFWREAGYFDRPAETKPLLHTWSLGVEEQFYLLYPVVLFLIFRYFRKRHAIGIVLSILLILSLGISALAV